MRKTILKMLCIILFSACLFGCSCNNPQDTADRPTHPIAQDATSPFILDIIDSFSSNANNLPDQILTVTEECTVYRKGGHCFLDFKSGNHKVSMNISDKDSCGHAMIFDSMEELCQWLGNPDFSGNTEEGIRHCFPLHPEYGFFIPDSERLCILDLPDEYYLQSVSIKGEQFSLVYETYERLPSGRYGGILIQFISEDWFAYDLARYCRFQRGTAPYSKSYVMEEKNATVYEYEEAGNQLRDIQYILQTDTQTLFVAETYILKPGDVNNDYILADITIIGSAHGMYFSIRPYYSDKEELIQLITELEIVEYTP